MEKEFDLKWYKMPCSKILKRKEKFKLPENALDNNLAVYGIIKHFQISKQYNQWIYADSHHWTINNEKIIIAPDGEEEKYFLYYYRTVMGRIITSGNSYTVWYIPNEEDRLDMMMSMANVKDSQLYIGGINNAGC